MNKYKLKLCDEQIDVVPFKTNGIAGGNYTYISCIDNTHTFKDFNSTITITTEQLELNELYNINIGDEVYIKYTL